MAEISAIPVPFLFFHTRNSVKERLKNYAKKNNRIVLDIFTVYGKMIAPQIGEHCEEIKVQSLIQFSDCLAA